MFVLDILSYNLLVTNRLDGWVQRGRKLVRTGPAEGIFK